VTIQEDLPHLHW